MAREIAKRFTVKKSTIPKNTIVCQITLVSGLDPACYSVPCRSKSNFSKWYTLIDIKYLPVSTQPHKPQHESPIKARPQDLSETGLSQAELSQYASHCHENNFSCHEIFREKIYFSAADSFLQK